MAYAPAPAGRGHPRTARWLSEPVIKVLSGRGHPGAQLLVLGLPLLFYFGARAVVADQRQAAMANAASILDFEYRVGLDWESTFQAQASEYDWLITGSNWVYMFGHFPLILTSLVVLWLVDRKEFVGLRNGLIVSGAIGLVCFALYPVAPPRLFAPGLFVDTLAEQSRSYLVLQNPAVTNQFAAVPSLHVGWNLLVVLALVRVIPWRFGRALIWTLAPLMATAVVLTANHWVIDIAAGLAVGLAGFVVARLSLVLGPLLIRQTEPKLPQVLAQPRVDHRVDPVDQRLDEFEPH